MSTAIQLDKVLFSYPKAREKTVLNIEAWRVEAGEHVFIHGPSGTGKSTLLNLVSGMLAPSSGELSILGQRLDTMSNRQRDRFRADHIGYIFQQFNLIPYLDAIDNIRLASHFSKRQAAGNNWRKIAETLLSSFNIPSSEWRKPIAHLSIGQQQRVAIARAMINQPELLIADEPTSSLDPDNRNNFLSELMSLASEHNTTLLFVSHDMGLSESFNRVEALNDINRAACVS